MSFNKIIERIGKITVDVIIFITVMHILSFGYLKILEYWTAEEAWTLSPVPDIDDQEALDINVYLNRTPINRNEVLFLENTAEDPDDDPIIYDWIVSPNENNPNENYFQIVKTNNTLKFISETPGTYEIEGIACDNFDLCDSRGLLVLVE